ncbi:hypothetical protein QR680_018478 [Steinernema hermaphroditum]|uniref:Uncharacterized protein n=1 Tax=Steinernema hermaphroditum TaxID=289476 RepID=A0AA39HI37_9BILA|nr:hypothetical protein QR680_018478 [Steinernema hermaphroditum]
MEVISLPDLEGELEDALLCSVTDGKVIVHSENNEIRIYDRQSHEIERHICPSGYRQRKGNTNEKHYNCFCNVTSDAVYHSCVTHEENERGSFSVEIEIYKLVDKSMRNVKTLKYYNASNFRVYGSFYIELNKKWITFSLEVMKEIVFNDCHSFAVFAYHDHFYAFDGTKHAESENRQITNRAASPVKLHFL